MAYPRRLGLWRPRRRARAQVRRRGRNPHSFRYQRKRPNRAAGGDDIPRRASWVTAAASGQDRYILDAFVGVSDRRPVDGGASLKLPQLLPGILVERDELAGQLAGEQQAAAGRQRACRNGKVMQRN